MTPQEFKTLCKGVPSAAWSRVLTPSVSVERVKSWFNGEAPIPAGVIEQVRYFMSVIEHEKLRLVEDFHERGTTKAYFVIYLNNEDFRIHDPQIYRVLRDSELHQQLYWSLATALMGIGCGLTRVPFQSDSYYAWLHETRLLPNSENLELWAKLHHRPQRLDHVGLATPSPGDKTPQRPLSLFFPIDKDAEKDLTPAQQALIQERVQIVEQCVRAVHEKYKRQTQGSPDQPIS